MRATVRNGNHCVEKALRSQIATVIGQCPKSRQRPMQNQNARYAGMYVVVPQPLD